MKTIKDLVVEVLEGTYLMSLATVDESGPWVSDVVFVTNEKFEIFWFSRTDARHSVAITKNPKVAGSITKSTNQGEENVGIQFEGIAEKVDGDILEMAEKHLKKRKKPAPRSEGEIFKPGQSWYKLIPSKIELIYEPYFGFEKQELKLKV